MNKLWESMEDSTNLTRTENDALTHKSSKSYLLDLFAMGGSMRTRSPEDITTLFSRALAEDKELAIRCLFYIRDIRGGLGERKIPKILFAFLISQHTELAEKVAKWFPEFGRWDDIFISMKTNGKITIPAFIVDLVKFQLGTDKLSDTPSLLAKWMPSENASRSYTKKLGTAFRNALKMSPRSYRQMLSALRKKINIVESAMSAKNWENIDYGKLPSKAGFKYRKAFGRHDPDGYADFITKVEKGEKTINASTLFPYEIVRQIMNGDGSDRAMEAMWKALPDYGDDRNALVVCDTSGSMRGHPITVSVSLALYFAERNQGAFAGRFITFSEQPELQTVMGDTLESKVYNLKSAHWEMNTNVEAVFDLILDTAMESGVTQNEMPSAIYIISDMEFDRCCGRNDKTIFKHIEKEYRGAGYEMPVLVFWNVNARNDNLPVTMHESGTILVSGSSPSVFKMAVNRTTPYQFMLDTLNSERYIDIRV